MTVRDRFLRAKPTVAGGLVASIILLAAAVALTGRQAAPSPSPEGVGSLDPALYHTFPDLEAKLPRDVAGSTLETMSFAAAGPELGARFLDDAIAELGGDRNDLQMAVAHPSADGPQLIVVALHLPGRPGADLLTRLASGQIEGSVAPRQLGGHDVITMTEGTTTSYAFASAELLVIVGGSEDLVDAAIRAFAP